MMILTLSPMRRDDALTLARAGEVLVVNGTPVDLGALSEGEEIDAGLTGCPYLVGPIRREGGVLHLTVILPHGATPPQETLFPAPVTVAGDGPIPLPAPDLPAPDLPAPDLPPADPAAIAGDPA
jgi:hypothetical protein